MEQLRKIVKAHLYIIFSERFIAENSSGFFERYVAKHPLLKPEIIVKNDEIQGFKKTSKRVASLEDFPIFLEIEGVKENEENYFIDNIELYVEANINCQKRLTDIIFLGNLYKDIVLIERILDVAKPGDESLVITSKLQDNLLDLTLDVEDGFFMDINDFTQMFGNKLTLFTHIINVLNALIIKDQTLDKIEKDIGFFPGQNKDE